MLRAIGLMSGTSMDGIDAALIESDGRDFVRPIGFHFLPYSPEMRADLRQAMAEARDMAAPQPSPFILDVEQRQTLLHAKAVAAVLARYPGALDVIGFHGQTIAHRPERGWTWQIGDGALLARCTNSTVVYDFRSADVAAGGHGAPLIPAYHRALMAPLRELRGLGCRQAMAVLNLGGVGNITWAGVRDDDILAFDTGPGNALIDDWVHQQCGLTHDEGGKLAAAGTVDPDILAALSAHGWFAKAPPKSLDRHDFHSSAVAGLSLEDGAATLTAFTAETVRLAFHHLPEPPAQLLVTGGGRHNHTLMQMLQERLKIEVRAVESVGWHGDALEAEGFAYLAVRALGDLPLSWPTTTGVPAPQRGGRIVRP